MMKVRLFCISQTNALHKPTTCKLQVYFTFLLQKKKKSNKGSDWSLKKFKKPTLVPKKINTNDI